VKELNYRHAIVRNPGKMYRDCLSTHPLHETVSLAEAIKQHSVYCEVLEELGLEVIYLPIDNDHPDSCFVEDNAVVAGGKALICRMAEKSREGEQVDVAKVLEDYMPVKWAASPAKIEGGDVVHHEDGLISGVTQRTNSEGVQQLKSWLNVPVKTIQDPEIMHLKSYVTYLGKGVIIATADYADHPTLKKFQVISPPKGEEYAADTVALGDIVLMAEGYPESHRIVKDQGFDVVPLKVSEIQKCDGALSCLSILF
jgi:dimethylargininase